MPPRRIRALLRGASLLLALGLLWGAAWTPWTGAVASPSGTSWGLSIAEVGPAGAVLPSYTLSTIPYTSSIDGFNLSYIELLPAGYSANTTYPMAVELHGIAATETTPMDGGYPTTTRATTLDAAAAAGFILVTVNTRTGVGFYTDSPYTGPQAQDVLDAIAHEEALRSIGPVFLYGFSMGAMGAMEIGLAHPNLFAGIGAIATFSDLYETTAFQFAHNLTTLPDLLLAVGGGVLPNASAFSHQVFDGLSQLRFHPERTSGLRVYLASGGLDSSATNNPEFWPYQQGNDSVLNTSCLTVAAYDEPSNCTLPLAVLHAVDPANYTYRYLFEPNGPHDYGLLNATDVYGFFSGEVSTGTYYGMWPNPVPLPPPTPLVTLATRPFDCGTIVADGTPYPDGVTLSLSVGNHTVGFRSCPGSALASVRATDGVAYDGAAGTIDVAASGAIVATFSPPVFHVTLAANIRCDAISLNGSIVPNGSVTDQLAGTYALGAGACPPFSFSSWNSTGMIRVGDAAASSTTLTIFGNGSIEAHYELPPPPPGTGRVYVYVAPASCAPVVIDGAYLADGSFVDLALGTHTSSAPACAAHDFVSWTVDGGVVPTGGAGTGGGPSASSINFSVSADGSLTAVYAPRTPLAYSVAIQVAPTVCGRGVVLDNASYGNGTTVLLAPGLHALASADCAAHQFQSWSVLGALDVTTDSISVSGNGTLTATFVPIQVHATGGGGNGSSSSASWAESPVLWAAIGVAIGVAAGVGIAWRWRPGPRTPKPPD